jgi:lauroyl/myristoyl acyltransferase
MIKVKIKLKNKKFIIPVPYGILTLIGSLLTSKLMMRMANKAIDKNRHSFKLPQLKKDDLKPIIQALSENKGLVLVETKLQDGTEVFVKL